MTLLSPSLTRPSPAVEAPWAASTNAPIDDIEQGLGEAFDAAQRDLHPRIEQLREAVVEEADEHGDIGRRLGQGGDAAIRFAAKLGEEARVYGGHLGAWVADGLRTVSTDYAALHPAKHADAANRFLAPLHADLGQGGVGTPDPRPLAEQATSLVVDSVPGRFMQHVVETANHEGLPEAAATAVAGTLLLGWALKGARGFGSEAGAARSASPFSVTVDEASPRALPSTRPGATPGALQSGEARPGGHGTARALPENTSRPPMQPFLPAAAEAIETADATVPTSVVPPAGDVGMRSVPAPLPRMPRTTAQVPPPVAFPSLQTQWFFSPELDAIAAKNPLATRAMTPKNPPASSPPQRIELQMPTAFRSPAASPAVARNGVLLASSPPSDDEPSPPRREIPADRVDFQQLAVRIAEQVERGRYESPFEPTDEEDRNYVPMVGGFPGLKTVEYPGDRAYDFGAAGTKGRDSTLPRAAILAHERSLRDALKIYMEPRTVGRWMHEFFSGDFVASQAMREVAHGYGGGDTTSWRLNAAVIAHRAQDADASARETLSFQLDRARAADPSKIFTGKELDAALKVFERHPELPLALLAYQAANLEYLDRLQHAIEGVDDDEIVYHELIGESLMTGFRAMNLPVEMSLAVATAYVARVGDDPLAWSSEMTAQDFDAGMRFLTAQGAFRSKTVSTDGSVHQFSCPAVRTLGDAVVDLPGAPDEGKARAIAQIHGLIREQARSLVPDHPLRQMLRQVRTDIAEGQKD